MSIHMLVKKITFFQAIDRKVITYSNEYVLDGIKYFYKLLHSQSDNNGLRHN